MDTPPVLESEAVQLAYWAGIVDGEGSIMFQKQFQASRLRPRYSKPVYYPVITVANTNKALIDELHAFFQLGHLRHAQRDPTHKVVWTWCVKSSDAITVATRILPYLRIKHRRAELIIEAQKHLDEWKHRKRTSHAAGLFWIVPEDELVWREQAYAQIKVLNQRGVNPRYT